MMLRLAGFLVALCACRAAEPVTVIAFISARCPVSNAYGDRLESIYSDYSARHVRFRVLNPNVNESAAEIAENSKRHGFKFPVGIDRDSQLAIELGAEFTPEVFVLDGGGKVRYRGGIDDAQNEARVKTRSLRAALDSVLAGKPVQTPVTKVFGCTVKKPPAGSLKPLDREGYRALIQPAKVVLVDFWATWCEPCRAELPELAGLNRRLAGTAFRMATVSIDEPEQEPAARRLLAASQLSGPGFIKRAGDDRRFIDAVDPKWSGALPALFLYDRSGRLAGSFTGDVDMKALEPAIRKLL